jgi:hypothetical protein
VVGGPGKADTWSLETVWIRIVNGNAEPVTIDDFELPGIEFSGNVMSVLPKTLAGGETFRGEVAVKPVPVGEDEVSDKGSLKIAVPVLRYRIGATGWERRGSEGPEALGGMFA